ncbi:MAG: hypothetical protein FJ100_20635 [Deltaproteobacteria bacterium]|nr:hypothetical protein [Deltaproteobacteria bacterium]
MSWPSPSPFPREPPTDPMTQPRPPTRDWVLRLHIEARTVQILALEPSGHLPLQTTLPRCRCQGHGLWRLLELVVGQRRQPVRAVISAGAVGPSTSAQIFCTDEATRSCATRSAAAVPVRRACTQLDLPLPGQPGPGDRHDPGNPAAREY